MTGLGNDILNTFTQIQNFKNKPFYLVVNQEKEKVLIEISFFTLAEDVTGLEDFLDEYMKESGILQRLEALENGETGVLDENPNSMDFTDLGNVSVVRGVWDETNRRFYC